MRNRLVCLVLGTLLVPALSRADDHNADFYAAHSRHDKGESAIWGYHFSFAKEIPHRWGGNVGIVMADISLHTQTHDDRRTGQVTIMAGPRGTWPVTERIKVNAQFLIGGYSNYGLDAGDNLAMGVGAAGEFLLVRYLAVRAQVDEIWRKGDPKAALRISIGGVFRIE